MKIPIRIADTSVIPFISMLLIVISLIVSLPYFLGKALDEQTAQIKKIEDNIYKNETRIENNLYANETNQRIDNVRLFNFTLDNVTKQGKINEGKIDSLLDHFNLSHTRTRH